MANHQALVQIPVKEVIFLGLAKVSHSGVAHSACGADERGTQPLYDHVSHSNPRENVFSEGLVWDTLAKKTVGYLVT